MERAEIFQPVLSIFMCLIANYCTRWPPNFKGLSQDGVRADFLKNLRASLFNDDLSNEPDVDRIHLAGQYL